MLCRARCYGEGTLPYNRGGEMGDADQRWSGGAEMGLYSSDLRKRLQRLSWGDGLTREEMYNQWKDMPRELYRTLPPGHRFANVGEVMSYLDHLKTGSPIVISPYGAPSEYGPSPTAVPVRESSTVHGIGSGLHEGDTGSEAQTGAWREGASPPKRKDPDYPHDEMDE